MHTERGNFFLPNTASSNRPDAGQLADALRHYPELPAGANQNLFKETYIIYRTKVRPFFAGKIASEIDDGVAHQLPGTVVGYVATAIDLMQLHATLRKQLIAGDYVRPVSIAAQRDNWWMLQQQEGILDEVLLSCRDDLLLNRKSFLIRDASEMKKIDVHAVSLEFRVKEESLIGSGSPRWI